MLGWHDSTALKSVLPTKEAAAFKKHFGFTTVEQLLRHYPRVHTPHGVNLSAGLGVEGDIITVIGTIIATNERLDRRGNKMYTIVIEDQPHSISATFFRASWISKVLTQGTRAMFTGKLKFFRGVPQLQHPDYLILPRIGEKKRSTGALKGLTTYGDVAEVTELLSELDYIPIYPAKAAMPTWRIFGAIHEVLRTTEPYADPLGGYAPKDLPSFDEAIRGIHEPGPEGPGPAIDRLRYDEAMQIALVMAVRRADSAHRKAVALEPIPGGQRQRLLDGLRFPLTDGQRRVIAEISEELNKPRPMQRLLQGEVGSGKTIVSVISMLQAVDQRKQCALLAPTEVLATQHARSIQETLTHAGVDAKVVVLTGSLNTKQRKQALLDIVSGEADIIVGTHAIIQEGVDFFDLAFCVVDEQHRFGVEQRNHLRGKGRDGTTPHLLVMTATPIPRTIAMTAFGDLSMSVLTELPGGRRPIESFVVAEINRRWVERAFQRMREEIEAGRQVYVVCPRIQGEGGVEETFAYFREQVFPDLRVGMLHGKMPADAKEEVMLAFAAGELDLLVATTVIEVGIDVPNATIMMIRESERFGVSQLHQLRGRVGRGGNASICFFHTGLEAGEEAVKRVQAVAATTNGFDLAEIDLEQRQEGDVLGARQSGTTNLKLLSLVRDREVIERANRDAAYLVSRDPELAQKLIVDVDDDSQGFIEKS
ncbi:ATP-dependent DNA helicase RecG [Corynebacterium vitaeruminis]|uniref:ATP-dependent DNA helicase RecG n=1 Tax=Corynebacterium vitaeruminis TaxID=38305 RepID=UPI000552445C|nr:ATP-dependent DNA helicase RecG [Corynebacterium vitaeruminis]